MLRESRAGFNEGVLFKADSNRLRQGRRFLATGLQPGNLKAYHGIIFKHVISFLDRLLSGPTDVLTTVPAYVSSNHSCIIGRGLRWIQATYWSSSRDHLWISYYYRRGSVHTTLQSCHPKICAINSILIEGWFHCELVAVPYVSSSFCTSSAS